MYFFTPFLSSKKLVKFFLLSFHYLLTIKYETRIGFKGQSVGESYHYHNGFFHQNWYGGGLLWGDFTHDITWPFDGMVFWDHLKKLKTLYFYHHSTYGYQTWQNAALGSSWGARSHEVMWLLSHLVLRDHEIMKLF